MFQPDGDFWTILYEQRGFRLRDAKGLRYIHRLLSKPGGKLHVTDLAAAEGSCDGPLDADAVERLRKAVANSIRYAIARIEKECPPLALHLTNALRTGTVCRYVPDRSPAWRC